MTGETADADAKRAEYLVFMSGWMGVDLARYGLDEPIGKRRFQRNSVRAQGFSVRRPRWARVGGPRHRRVGRDRRHGTARSSDPLCASRIRCRSGSRKSTSTASTSRMRSRPTVRPRRHRTRHIRPGGAESERCVTGMCPPVVGMAEGCDAHCGLQRRGHPCTDPNQEGRDDS